MTSIDENKKNSHKPKNGRISIGKVTKNVTQNFGVSVKDKMLYFTQGILEIQISGLYTHLSTSVDDW